MHIHNILTRNTNPLITTCMEHHCVKRWFAEKGAALQLRQRKLQLQSSMKRQRHALIHAHGVRGVSATKHVEAADKSELAQDNAQERRKSFKRARRLHAPWIVSGVIGENGVNAQRIAL
mmetsp:Transcript_72713/g.144135  ORF Transcript_72713/g.144135 Transcript_72713/m.144135 type:complete len:119 (+) Transcript_72713:220-576(+)